MRRPPAGACREGKSVMVKFSGVVAVLGLVLALAPSAGSAEGLGPTLQRIKDAGTITIGHREASVPLSYLDDNQKPIGFSVELCSLVTAKVKAKLGLP